MFLLNTILAWSISIIMNKKYDNNNIIIASRAYFLQHDIDNTNASCKQGILSVTGCLCKVTHYP
jgi:hypothetical protein